MNHFALYLRHYKSTISQSKKLKHIHTDLVGKKQNTGNINALKKNACCYNKEKDFKFLVKKHTKHLWQWPPS